MVCPYFNEEYIGYCSASVLPYVPSIWELEKQCFRDFSVCPIYNGSEYDKTLVDGKR